MIPVAYKTKEVFQVAGQKISTTAGEAAEKTKEFV